MLDHVDQQALDVRAIVVLVSHDHDSAVPQALRAVVLAAVVQADDLHDVLDLLIVDRLLEAGVAHIERLTSQGEDAILVTADDAQARHGERLGAVAFCEDERALFGALAAGPVRVLELREAEDPRGAAGGFHFLLHVDGLLGFGPLEHSVDDARVQHALHRCVCDVALGPELRGLQGHRLLGLGVEGRVHDQAIHKHPQVVSHVIRLDVHAALVLRIGLLVDGIDELVSDVEHMGAALRGADRVDEGHLRELPVGQGDNVLPTVPTTVIYLGLVVGLEVEIDIVLELLDAGRAVVQEHLAALVGRAGGVHDSLLHQRDDVLV
mmetsp:Transcript_73219/g.212024  ORF Transcript_73219/g.212024 Transcript_73219/m.212024 type:complete len:322 (-) Transcript_73219:780-1745(-)